MPDSEQCKLIHKSIDDLKMQLDKVAESLSEYKDKQAEHIQDFKIHEQIEKIKQDEIREAQEENTKAIRELILVNTKYGESTEGLIKAWDATQGTLRVLSTLGNLAKWIGGIATAIVAIFAGMDWWNTH